MPYENGTTLLTPTVSINETGSNLFEFSGSATFAAESFINKSIVASSEFNTVNYLALTLTEIIPFSSGLQTMIVPHLWLVGIASYDPLVLDADRAVIQEPTQYQVTTTVRVPGSIKMAGKGNIFSYFFRFVTLNNAAITRTFNYSYSVELGLF